MTQPVTVDQLRNLTDRAGHGLTPDEQQRLRDGLDQLACATDGELRRQLADMIAALGRAETELAGVRALRDRWVKAGPPPLGTPMSRWWDRRLVELGAALGPEQQGVHRYLSTGCLHGNHAYCQSMTGLNGSKRPGECKHCQARCICGCHAGEEQPGPAATQAAEAAHNDGPSIAECRDADRTWPLQKTGE
ncbi:hypothetical protein [Streptomyces europaeiscabiei]|uniref:hypothetical protein n=1 Tax=Streptomyces europaeiscabiei TaxID=146819 RepID=UPI0029A5CAA1|nr:hypothetical protein [Streptomyces europaeiscabiei]MDX2528018.1 hypothetical protein [Streptomyces europaeiscabiei]